jgi:ribose 5-phosphate isomerase B
MKVFIGADHRGFELKEQLKSWLMKSKYEVIDCGNTKLDPEDDFPDFSFPVAEGVASESGSLGILVCGSGGGVTIAANKVVGIRCVTASKVEDVKHNRAHDDANVMAIAANFTSIDEAQKLATAFLETPFDGGEKYKRRIAKITSYEQACCGGGCGGCGSGHC